MLDPSRDGTGAGDATRDAQSSTGIATPRLSACSHTRVRGPSPRQWCQVGERAITYRATKGGRVKSRQIRLLAPLAGDLAQLRIRCGRPNDHELVFGEWSSDDWDNWREEIVQPAAIAVGLPDDTIPRDSAR